MSTISQIAPDQTVWQRTFIESLDLKDAKEEKEVPTSFPYWNSDQFDNLQFQQELTANHKQKVIDVAKAILSQSIPELVKTDNMTIACTGSDGREEKLSPYSSPMEIVVIMKSADQLKSDTLEKIRKVVSQNLDVFFKKVDLKCLDKDSLLTHNPEPESSDTKKERPYPNRGLDAYYIAGSGELFTDYRKAFYHEIQDPKKSTALTAFRRDNVLPTCKLLSKVMAGQDEKEVNLSTGKVYYDGDRIKGVKYSYLRTVQLKLGLYVAKLIQNKSMSEKDFCAMPPSIVERIQWLAQKQLLKATPDEVKLFQKAYIASMVWFGISQKYFEINKQKEIVFSAADLNSAGKAISLFSERIAA